MTSTLSKDVLTVARALRDARNELDSAGTGAAEQARRWIAREIGKQLAHNHTRSRFKLEEFLRECEAELVPDTTEEDEHHG